MWEWECPTCHDRGSTNERPTFLRCYQCDSAAPLGTSPPMLRIQKVDTFRDEVYRAITEEMALTSLNTGHGKAQRAFGRKLLERLGLTKKEFR